MSVTQTVEIPPSRRLVIDVPPEVPSGSVILTFTPNFVPKSVDQKSAGQRGGFGCLKGQVWMADDFDAPLEDFKDYM